MTVLALLALYLLGVLVVAAFFRRRGERDDVMLVIALGWPVVLPLRMALRAGTWLGDRL